MLVIDLAAAIIHPGSRQWILNKLAVVGELGSIAWPEILSLVDKATSSQEEAAGQLKAINKMISEKDGVRLPQKGAEAHSNR